MSPAESADLVRVLMAAYPHSHVGPDTSSVYEARLVDLDATTARRAVARLVGSSKFLPTVAEIREAALSLCAGARRMGGEAWGDVNAEVRRVGYIDEPRFRDPLVAECVRLMGWRNICLGTNEAADRARFIELYDGLQERERADAASGIPLPPHVASRGELPEPTKRAPLPQRDAPALAGKAASLVADMARRSVNRSSWGDPSESIEARQARMREQARQLLEQEGKES